MMSAPESRIGIRRRGGRDTASRDTGATLPRARSSCNPSPDLLWRYIAHFLGGRRTPKIAICPWPCPTGVTSQHPLRQDPHRGTETLGATPRAYPGPRNERSPEEKPMIVRLHDVTKVAADHFRIALDLTDPDRAHWEAGDCVVHVDVHDGARHTCQGRGPLDLAIDLYQLARDEPPEGTESRLMWEMGRAVCRYFDRLFEARILCPFNDNAADDAQRRAE